MEKLKIIDITDEEYEKMRIFDYDDELKEESLEKNEYQDKES